MVFRSCTTRICRDQTGLSSLLGLKRTQADPGLTGKKSSTSATSYRALNLKQTVVEAAPFKYPNSFMLRSPSKSFVVQAPDELTWRVWEQGTPWRVCVFVCACVCVCVFVFFFVNLRLWLPVIFSVSVVSMRTLTWNIF